MNDVVYCNRERAEKILKTYFSVSPIITKIYKDEDSQYFIEALTIPGCHRTEWQYRPWKNNITGKVIRSCFGSIHKGDRRYDLNGEYPDELMRTINKTFAKAIGRYERGCDILQSEGIQHTKGFFKNIFYHFTKSDKRRYIWTIIILSILLLLSLTSCIGDDSIQNYVGSEVISSKEYFDESNKPYYVLYIRTRHKINSSSYRIEKVICRDAKGYQVGDTIKLRKFQK